MLKIIKTSSGTDLLIAITAMVATSLTFSPAMGAGGSPWDQTLKTLFSEAAIVAVACEPMPADSQGEPDHSPALCGASPMDFQAFQQALRQTITRMNEAGSSITAVTDWKLENSIEYERSFKIPDGAFDLRFTQGKIKVFDSSTEHGGGSLPVTPYAPGTETVHDPVLISKVQPVYPELARKAGIAAIVHLKATVTEAGTVSGVQIVSCSSPDLGFEEAAESAVLQWKYQPGTLNGKPMEVSFDVTLAFTIN